MIEEGDIYIRNHVDLCDDKFLAIIIFANEDRVRFRERGHITNEGVRRVMFPEDFARYFDKVS